MGSYLIFSPKPEASRRQLYKLSDPPTNRRPTTIHQCQQRVKHNLSAICRFAVAASGMVMKDVEETSDSDLIVASLMKVDVKRRKATKTKLTRNDSIAQLRWSPMQRHRTRLGIFVDGEVSRSALRRCFLGRVEDCHAVGTFTTRAMDHLQRMAKRPSF